MSKHTWNKEYYDILDFFYFEPQHLGKAKNTKNPKPYEKVNHRLRNMEVTLNHQFNLFFQLLPKSLFHLFFTQIIKELSDDDFQFQGDSQLNIHGATQPDLFFKGEHSCIAIEMKISAKSSLDQVMKYAMLFHFSQKNDLKAKDNHLIFIGKGNLKNQFKEKFTSTDLIKDNLNTSLIPETTRKGNINLIEQKEDIISVAKAMSITFINYQNIFDLLTLVKDNTDTSSPYFDTVFKLINGLKEELISRKLSK